MAVAALIVALVAGFLGWNTLARPAPIEERMPVASSGPVAGAGRRAPVDPPRAHRLGRRRR
ncbi:MAG: hypothetical protein R2716_00590 [Microthrixaceae bacterium]